MLQTKDLIETFDHDGVAYVIQLARTAGNWWSWVATVPNKKLELMSGREATEGKARSAAMKRAQIAIGNRRPLTFKRPLDGVVFTYEMEYESGAVVLWKASVEARGQVQVLNSSIENNKLTDRALFNKVCADLFDRLESINWPS